MSTGSADRRHFLPCRRAGDPLRGGRAGGIGQEDLPGKKQTAPRGGLLHHDRLSAPRPAVSERSVRVFRRWGHERHFASMPGVGGQSAGRRLPPSRRLSVLEAGPACLPAVLFRAVIWQSRPGNGFSVARPVLQRKGGGQSRMVPSVEMVTTCHGINFPLCCRAVFAACSSPPQQGTSMRTTVTLFMSLFPMISVSFSA